jgi:hypothetical protein
MTKEIALSGGLVALVDDGDYELVNGYSWVASPGTNTTYAKARVSGACTPQKNVYLHRLILNAPRGVEVDHKNRNGLDCRRENIRLASKGQNMWNAVKMRTARGKLPSSQYKGVSERRNCKNKIWRASIAEHVELGCFDSEQEAAIAYNKAAILHYGPFARLNVVLERIP